jgi:penicillin-binding protein 1A
MKQVNADKNYKDVTNAKFPDLPQPLREKLNCDLYELNDDLSLSIQMSILKRDSLIQADTSANPPETFLQTIYKRKVRKALAQHQRDSIANELEAVQAD